MSLTECVMVQDAEAKVFLTSNFGIGPNVTLTKGNIDSSVASGFGYASLLLNTQRDGEAFVPDWRTATAVDYSCFTTNASTVSGLDVAVTHGGPVFGCCPKTAAGPSMTEDTLAGDRPASMGSTQRRVMFGWLQHGYQSNPRLPYENTIALPRDLSVVHCSAAEPAGFIWRRLPTRAAPELRKYQAITTTARCPGISLTDHLWMQVPELKALRRGPPVKSTYSSMKPDGSPLWVGSGGNQLVSSLKTADFLSKNGSFVPTTTI